MNMNWFGNQCRRWKQSLSLLASGELPESEREKTERHLRDCADCRSYYEQIKNVTQSLADYRESVAAVEPTQAATQRWAWAIKTADGVKSKPSWREWWHELCWSCRYAWGGFATLWLVMWMINREPPEIQGATASAATQTFAEERRMLAELLPVAHVEPADEPRRKGSPRSEWRGPDPRQAEA
jgi:anti-sigma factor RsiW